MLSACVNPFYQNFNEIVSKQKATNFEWKYLTSAYICIPQQLEWLVQQIDDLKKETRRLSGFVLKMTASVTSQKSESFKGVPKTCSFLIGMPFFKLLVLFFSLTIVLCLDWSQFNFICFQVKIEMFLISPGFWHQLWL